jgi:TatD DNase family protein
MKLIDTHCHLNADQFIDSWTSVLSQAHQTGVSNCFVVGWDEASSQKAIDLSKQNPQIKAIIGLHPVDVQDQSSLQWVMNQYQSAKSSIIAIGEIGLDYYWKKEFKEQQLQIQFLIKQIELANQFNLPIVIHCRDAYDAILPILKAHPVKQGGVMHCYAGPSTMVEAFVGLGFFLSFGGPITFKNATEARLALKATPLDRILIETDSPYLSPHPFRGKENTPTHLPIIFKQVCETLEITAETLEPILYQNTLKAFHVKTL